MAHKSSLKLSLCPDVDFLPILMQAAEEYCVLLKFPKAVAQQVACGTEEACGELIRSAGEAGAGSEFTLKMDYRDQACIVELIFDRGISFDPVAVRDNVSPHSHTAEEDILMDEM